MKKIKNLVMLFTIVNLATSCNQIGINFEKNEAFNETDDSLIKTCYSKDSSSEFFTFLNNNPDEIVSTYRAAFPNNNENQLTKDEMFAQIWESLKDEEKKKLKENFSEAKMFLEKSIGVDKESELGRAVLEGDSLELENTAKRYGLMCELDDYFGDVFISAKYAPENLGLSKEDIIPAVQIIEYCMQYGLWEYIEIILKDLNYPIKLEELKEDYKQAEYNQNCYDNNRAGAVIDYKENALINNLGSQIPDGTVLLMCSKNKAFGIAGNWLHAGIFSKKRYDNKKGDASLCVFSAQPDQYQDFPENMQPDRPGYACLDTVFMYTRQKRVAAILPKEYSTTKAGYAVDNAKKIFYDTHAKYQLPFNEFFYLGNTSHDETNENTYCSKVAYTGWKKAGVNLDSNTFAGNLISPDDIYSSSFDRYASITIYLFGWSKTWTWQTYSATSKQLIIKAL